MRRRVLRSASVITASRVMTNLCHEGLNPQLSQCVTQGWRAEISRHDARVVDVLKVAARLAGSGDQSRTRSSNGVRSTGGSFELDAPPGNHPPVLGVPA